MDYIVPGAFLFLMAGLLWNSHKITRWFNDELEPTVAAVPDRPRRYLENPWLGRSLAVLVVVAAVLGSLFRVVG